MNNAMKQKLLVVLAVLTLGSSAPAALSWSWNPGAPIPDANLNGWSDTRTLSGVWGFITDVNVTLNISGGFNGDLYVYLSHGGQTALLLNRVGRTALSGAGYGDAGFNITLSDGSADIHSYGGNGGSQLTGTWGADGRDIDPLASGATFDAATRQNGGNPLGLFNNADPNGAWTIFVSDVSGGNQSTVVSWGLGMTTAPEPMNVAAGLFAALFGAFHLIRFARRKGLKTTSGGSAADARRYVMPPDR